MLHILTLLYYSLKPPIFIDLLQLHQFCYTVNSMLRPGNINGLQGYTPKRQSNFRGFAGQLGTFGKGYMAPPPAAPPGAPAPNSAPAKYIGGKWVCSGPAPVQTADSYYHCCPGGWTKTGFHITRPCDKDYGQIVCGPLPEGASIDEGVCCENLKEWMPNIPDGSDPCVAAEDALIAQGKVVPGRAESMLAPALDVDQGPLISPTIMIVGGLAVAALFAVTIVIKLKS